MHPRKATFRDPLLTPCVRTHMTSEVFRDLCRLSGSAFALKCFMLHEDGQFSELVNLDFDFNEYSTRRFLDRLEDNPLLDYQIACFFKKRVDLEIGSDRLGAAVAKWCESERSCGRVNDLFRKRWQGLTSSSPAVERVISRARHKIAAILRDYDPDFVRSAMRFGPGADLSTRGVNTAWYDKFRTSGTVTVGGLAFLNQLLEADDRRLDSINRAKLVKSNRLAFVPKNAKTDRAICVEPRWNVYAQLGIGELMARRLRHCGIDIRDQTWNQRLAQRAYKDGLATIDLSSASDTVSTNLVIDLLADSDPRWIESLLQTRAPYCLYDGKELRVEKLSSMGNGYTFPLETLIFYALAYACTEDVCRPTDLANVSAYGDDIIVPSSAGPLLLEVLRYLGFKPNGEKSFISGVFYESCGTDWYKGVNVRPIFHQEEVTTIEHCYTFHNQIVALARRAGRGGDTACRKIWNLRHILLRGIPESLRLFGPSHGGDGVLHTSFDKYAQYVLPIPRKWVGHDGYELWSWVTVNKPREGNDYEAHLLSKLSGVVDTGNGVQRRSSTVHRKAKVRLLGHTDAVLI